MSVITKIFGTYSDHQIKKIIPTVNKIEALADKYKAMSDGEMREMTDKFRARLKDGEELEDILPEAYAIINPKAPNALDETLSAKQIRFLTSLAGCGVAFKIAQALHSLRKNSLSCRYFAVCCGRNRCGRRAVNRGEQVFCHKRLGIHFKRSALRIKTTFGKRGIFGGKRT